MAILTVMALMVDRPQVGKWPPFEIVHRHHHSFFFFVLFFCALQFSNSMKR